MVLVSFVLNHICELPSHPSPEKVDPWIFSDPLQSATNLRFNGGCAICVNLRVKKLAILVARTVVWDDLERAWALRIRLKLEVKVEKSTVVFGYGFCRGELWTRETEPFKG